LQGAHRCEWKVFTVRSHQLQIQLFESAVFCIILTKQKFTWISGRIYNWEKRMSFFLFLKLFYTFLLSFVTKQDVTDSSVVQTRMLISSNIRVLMIATWRQSERPDIFLGFCCRLFIVFRTLYNF
jgi:hypothetical protein